MELPIKFDNIQHAIYRGRPVYPLKDILIQLGISVTNTSNAVASIPYDGHVCQQHIGTVRNHSVWHVSMNAAIYLLLSCRQPISYEFREKLVDVFAPYTDQMPLTFEDIPSIYTDGTVYYHFHSVIKQAKGAVTNLAFDFRKIPYYNKHMIKDGNRATTYVNINGLLYYIIMEQGNLGKKYRAWLSLNPHFYGVRSIYV